MQDTKHVKGLKELGEFLRTLPVKMEKNILRSAMRQGAKVIANEAKNLVPVSPPNARNARRYGAYAGMLRDSIRVSQVTGLKPGQVGATVKAGGGKKGSPKGVAYYAAWVEYGTAAHQIKAPKGGALTVNGRLVTHIDHPGAAPRPYLRPAADNKAGEAVVAAGNWVKKRLTKEGLEGVGDVVVEEE